MSPYTVHVTNEEPLPLVSEHKRTPRNTLSFKTSISCVFDALGSAPFIIIKQQNIIYQHKYPYYKVSCAKNLNFSFNINKRIGYI